MRVLFVDDDLENVNACARALSEAGLAETLRVATVEDAVRALHGPRVDVLVMDLFIPLGETPRATLGPRARKYEEQLGDLGGLVLLDELARVPSPPAVLLHTACQELAVLDLARERGAVRVRKPAPVEVLLRAVIAAIEELG